MPAALRTLLDSRNETRDVSVECVVPEHRIPFDGHGGEPRNADLAFVGYKSTSKIAVTVEAKADEPFGATVAETIADALERGLENPRSRGVARVVDVVRALVPPRGKGHPHVAALRYQLLTATAGTLAYAREHEAATAVLVVHEFVTDKTRDERRAQNAEDYQAFLHRLCGRPPSQHEVSGLLGPFPVPGAPLFRADAAVLIGKIVTNRRSV